MIKELRRYITCHFEELEQCSWSEEALSMNGDELFEHAEFKSLFEDRLLHTKLYYPNEINSAILPFEIHFEDTLVGLGYMDDEKQNLILLRYEEEDLINLV